MKRVITAVTALSLATLIQASPASGQDRWGIELRTGGAVATQDQEREVSEHGFGFEGNVEYRFLPHLAVYTGWDWMRFSALDDLAGPDMELEETGYALGLRFEHPVREESPLAWWVRAGGTYNHLELENDDGEVVEDSGHGLGAEAGAGLSLTVGQRWNLTPGIRYRVLSRELEINNVEVPVELEYLTFEMGIAFRF